MRTDATVACWGLNLTNELTPVPVGLTDVVSLNAGYRQACAVKRDGAVVCWGGNDFGESDPPAGLQAIQVSGLFQHNCPHRGASLFVGRNEEAGIRECYEKVKEIFARGLPQYVYEHLFIDNCSTDQTPARLRALARCVRPAQPPGRGSARHH